MRFFVVHTAGLPSLRCLTPLLALPLLLSSLTAPAAFAQAPKPDLDLLVFDAVPLSIEAQDTAIAPPAEQAPYRATELIVPPHSNPQPVAVTLQQQILPTLAASETISIGDIEKREALLKQLEQSGDAYTNDLAEILMDLAGAHEKAGDFGRSQELYERASHIIRVNKGLFSPEQIPAIEQLFNSYLMSGDLYAADQQQEYLFYLQRKIHSGNNAALIPALQEYAAWNVRAFLSYIPASLPPPPAADANASEDTTDKAVAPARASTPSAIPDIALFRVQHLERALLHYRQLVEVLLATSSRSDPRLSEAERQLAVINFLYATEPVMMIPSADAFEPPSLYSDATLRRVNGFSEGRKSLERRVSYLKQNEAIPAVDVARARLELADWMIATHTRSELADVFTNAYEEFVASGATTTEIADVFHPPLPVQVPTFLIRGFTRQSLGIPIEAALEYRGYVDVEYSVSKIGDSISPKVLYRSPETPDGVIEILLRGLRRAEFRPRMQDGKLLDNDKITARYYYAY